MKQFSAGKAWARGLLLGAASALSISSAQALPNLVANPGFEANAPGTTAATGFTGWTHGGNLGSSSIVAGCGVAGSQCARLGPIGSNGTLSQLFSTFAGQNYRFSFTLGNGAGTPNDFDGSFAGTSIFSAIDAGATALTSHSMIVTAPTSSSSLIFSFQHDPNFWFLDDVVLEFLGCPVSAGDDICLLESTSDFTNNIDALGHVSGDTLRLGGALGFSFDASDIGTQYINFEKFEKIDGNTVTLTGTALAANAANWDIQAGTLIASGGDSIFDMATIDVDSLATFELTANETIGSLSGASGSFLELNGNTLTTGGNGTSTTFSGQVTGTGGLTKNGAGNFTLANANNTYSGATTINAGTLSVLGTQIFATDQGAIGDASAVNITLAGASLVLLAGEQIGSLSGVDDSLVDLGVFTLVTGDSSNTIFAGDITGTSGSVNVCVDDLTDMIIGPTPDPPPCLPGNILTPVTVKGSLVKTGSGDFTLSGVNTYIGSTLVEEGKLILAGGQAIANVGAVNVGGGATLQLNASETIGSLSGAGFVPSPPPPPPAVCLADPLFPGCAGPLPSTPASVVNLQSFTLTTGGAVSSPDSTIFAGNIIGVGGNLVKVGSGEFTLAGMNTYTGTTIVNAGKLSLLGGSAIADTGLVAIAIGATLNVLSSETIGSLVCPSGGFITLAGTLTLGSTSLFCDAAVSGTGGLTKTGGGIADFGGTNTYSGATDISGGTFIASFGSAIGDSSAVTVAGGATLALALTASETIGSLAGAGGVSLSTANLTTGGNGGSTNFSGVISGSGSLTKIGGGTQTLSGVNLYTGTTFVNGGTLALAEAGGNAIVDTNAVNVGGGGTLALQTSETIGNLTGALGSFVNLNANTLTTGDASITTFAGVMSGTGGLTKQGLGIFVLSGANTFSGPANVNAGILQLSGGSAIANNGAVIVASGAVLELLTGETIGSLSGVAGAFVDLNANILTTGGDGTSTTFAGVISDTGGLTKIGLGNFTLSGANTYTGLTQANAGTLSLLGGSAIANTGAVNVGTGGTLALLASETIGSLAGSAGSFVNLNAFTLTTGDGSSTNFMGAMSGAGALTKQGGGIFTLSGTNTYAGLTTINAGTLAVTGGSAIADAGAVCVKSGGTLSVLTSETIGNLVDVPAGCGAAGSFVVLNGTLTLGDATPTTTFAGAMSGVGGLTKQGSGIFVLSGVNTYSGMTSIVAGTLSVMGGSAIDDSSAVNIVAAATLNLLASETIGPLSGAAGSFVTMGVNSLTINAASGSANFAGVISGSGTLTKIGGGTEILIGVNLHTGTTFVNAGVLAVSGGNAIIDAGAVNVGSGGTFALLSNETIGNLTGNAGSFVDFGANTLTTGDASSTTFAGTMSGAGGLTKQGAGNFTLSGANTHTGLTSVNVGTLTLAGGSAIANTGAVTVAGGATLALSASETIGNLSGAGLVSLGANTLTTGDASNTSFTGTTSGSGGLTKQGSGKFSTLTLAHTGLTTVAAGELNTNGNVAGNVTVNAGATLSGAFNIAGLLTSFGNVNPGNSPGLASTGGLAGATVINAEVILNSGGGPNNGVTHDFLSVTGAVTGNHTINIIPFAPSNAPVATTGNGFELVRVGGAVAANAFALSGPVIFGGFEFLLKYLPDYSGTDDGFFLQSAPLQEMSLNAALLSVGRATKSACRHDDNTNPNLGKDVFRVWADAQTGNVEAGGETGIAFDADHTCIGVGAEAAVTDNILIGISGGHSETKANVGIAQGGARLDGDGSMFQVRAAYATDRFYAVASVGYSKTYWDVMKAGGGLYEIQARGQIGHLGAGYRIPFSKSAGLTFSGGVDYDGASCGEGCLIAGSIESASQWSANIGARLDVSLFGGGLKPFVGVNLSDDIDGGNSVSFGGTTSVSDAASMVLDADLGFDAQLAEDISVFAKGRMTHGLDSDVEGYEASGGLRVVW